MDLGLVMTIAAMLGIAVVQRPIHEPDFSKCATPRDVCAVARRCDLGGCREIAQVVAEESARLGYKACVIGFFEAGKSDAGHAVALGRYDDGRYWYADNGRYWDAATFADVKGRVATDLNCDPDDLWWAVLWKDGDAWNPTNPNP